MKKEFTFNSEQLRYDIQLPKKRNWWWLLLLLLPFLLLIRFDKTVYVKTIDAESKIAVANTDVSFSYVKSYLYANGKFFTRDTMHFRQKTDSAGIATFDTLHYSLFSYLFRHFSQAAVLAASTCFGSDTLMPYFHSIGNKETLTLPLHPVFGSLDFKVIDKEDKEALPDSWVSIVTEIGGKQYIDSGMSDPGGKVLFQHVPKCGKLVRVMAGHDGYYPDSILNKNVADLHSANEAERTLQLTPIKKPIDFFVEDCQTRKPLAGATVTIEFAVAGKTIRKVAHTNVDGHGKGSYDEAHIVAKIHLSASHPFYRDSALDGWHLVKDFINPALYPKAKRTFCLEPEDISLEFQDIDSVTRLPLPNTQNFITIKRNGKEIKESATSGSDGFFRVGIQKGDILSIISQHQPDYDDNTTKIKDADAFKLLSGTPEERKIPLNPKVYEKPPKESCRVFVSGGLLGDVFESRNISVIYEEDNASEYVGEGFYPDNELAFPKAVETTFDGIAIDKGTRVIIYSEKNFQGTVLFDKEGPALINNMQRLDEPALREKIMNINKKIFKEPLQTNFPNSVRGVSETNMIKWGNGSMKVICNKK